MGTESSKVSSDRTTIVMSFVCVQFVFLVCDKISRIVIIDVFHATKKKHTILRLKSIQIWEFFVMWHKNRFEQQRLRTPNFLAWWGTLGHVQYNILHICIEVVKSLFGFVPFSPKISSVVRLNCKTQTTAYMHTERKRVASHFFDRLNISINEEVKSREKNAKDSLGERKGGIE